MKRLPLILAVTILTAFLVTPIPASEPIYEATVVGIDPEKTCPVDITYRFSRRRNMTREAYLGEEVHLGSLAVGMTVRWTPLPDDKAVIVGPTSSSPPPTPGTEHSGIARVTVTVETDEGLSLSFELPRGDWSVEESCLRLNASIEVSGLLEPMPEKTVMFVTHIGVDSMEIVDPYLDESRFNVLKWNYVFPDFPVWGDYFNYRSSDAEIHARLAEFKELDFSNIIYVDVSESHRSVSHRWSGCVLASGDWWSLMTLDPSKEWYSYLKEGMLGLTERFPEIDGFAIDRLDRCHTAQEAAWAAQLLEEVRCEADIPLKYVMNSLQPWQTELASMAVFIGSDGVVTQEPHLSLAIGDYGSLAEYTEYGWFYVNPFMDLCDEELVEGFEAILERHDFVFLDDYKAYLVDRIFPATHLP